MAYAIGEIEPLVFGEIKSVPHPEQSEDFTVKRFHPNEVRISPVRKDGFS